MFPLVSSLTRSSLIPSSFPFHIYPSSSFVVLRHLSFIPSSFLSAPRFLLLLSFSFHLTPVLHVSSPVPHSPCHPLSVAPLRPVLLSSINNSSSSLSFLLSSFLRLCSLCLAPRSLLLPFPSLFASINPWFFVLETKSLQFDVRRRPEPMLMADFSRRSHTDGPSRSTSSSTRRTALDTPTLRHKRRTSSHVIPSIHQYSERKFGSSPTRRRHPTMGNHPPNRFWPRPPRAEKCEQRVTPSRASGSVTAAAPPREQGNVLVSMFGFFLCRLFVQSSSFLC